MDKNLEYRPIETKTGVIINVRPMTAEDAPYLVDLFENMGAESRYNRFLQSAENVDIERIWTEAEKIAQHIIDISFGLVAFADLPDRKNVPVAGARYVLITPTTAEIAVSVRDDMQQKGIGMHLLRELIDHAAASGIDQLIGTIQNSNTAMWTMLTKLGLRLDRQPEGSYSIATLHLNESISRTEDWMDTAADYLPEPQIVW